jgi:germination protein M
MRRARVGTTRRLLYAVMTVTLAVAVVPLAGCGLFDSGGPGEGGTTPPGGSGLPQTTVTPPPVVTPGSTEATPVPASKTTSLRAYFVLNEKVQPVYRAVPYTTAVVKAAITELLAGPTSAEKAKGLSSQVPAGTKLLGVSLKNGVAYVDLSSAFGSGGGSLSTTLRLAQLVYTATQYPTVKSVVLKMNGKVVDVFSGEGIELSGQPQTRADYENETPAILMEMPAWGATERQPAVFKGTANVFEGQFTIEIIGPNGKVVGKKNMTAPSGTGTRGEWIGSVPYKISASGWGKVKAFDNSEKDGSEIDVVVIPVYLRK